MDSHLLSFEEIQARLLILEEQNRRFKRLGAVVLAIAALVVVMGQGPAKKIIEANEFVLRDSGGSVRARLSIATLPSGDEKTSTAEFVLFDKQGAQRMKIDSGFSGSLAGVYGATLTLADGNGKDRVYISANNTEGGVLSLLNLNGVPGTGFTTDSAALPYAVVKVLRTPMLAFTTKDDKQVRGTFSVGDDGDPTLGLTSADGKSFILGTSALGFVDSANIPVATFGRDSLFISDDQGFAATLGVKDLVTPRTGETHKTSAASLVMFDKAKNVIWKAP